MPVTLAMAAGQSWTWEREMAAVNRLCHVQLCMLTRLVFNYLLFILRRQHLPPSLSPTLPPSLSPSLSVSARQLHV